MSFFSLWILEGLFGLPQQSTVAPRKNAPKSSEKSHNSKFCLSPLTFFLLLSILAITDFGNKGQLCLVPSNLLLQGFTVF